MPLIDEVPKDDTPWFSNLLKSKFTPTSCGLLSEVDNGSEPYHFISVNEFEMWLSELENSVGIPLGRKLAHAAAESEEYSLTNSSEKMPNPFLKKMATRFEWINTNWEIRGLGKLELMKVESDATKLIIHNRAHSALSAGWAAATQEFLTNSRFRFHWTDDGNAECLVTLELDQRHIPKAMKVDPRWQDNKNSDPTAEGMHPLELAHHDFAGVWSIDGIRMMGINRDMLLRFEESIMPQLLGSTSMETNKFTWDTLQDSERKKIWSGFAEASKIRFLGTDQMVLIAEPEHWIHVGHRFLTRTGLGGVTSVEGIDDQGGVKLHLSKLFHPAIAAGILSAAWERSEARPCKLQWSCSHNGHIIQISSLYDPA